MTRLVKASTAAALVGPLLLHRGSRDRRGETASAPARPQRDELAEARAEIERLEAALLAVGTDAKKAEAVARDAGRREGRSEAADDSARRIAAIEDGVEAALAAWFDRLAALEPLAALVARAVLLRLVESGAAMDELVTRSIARQMALVRRETIAAIRVSATDFPDEESVAALAASAAARNVLILADDGLDSGACRMELQLGEIELGVRARWREAAGLLEALACDGGQE